MDPGDEQVRGTTRTASSPDPTVERDRLFVSYSHADNEWLQRFEVLLKPLVRRRRLFVWADRSLRATACLRAKPTSPGPPPPSRPTR